MLEKLFKRTEEPLLLPAPKEAVHSHQWEVVAKTHAAPVRQLPQTENIQILQNALFGVTAYLFQCVVCKEFKKEALPGGDLSELEELMVKAEAYGPQYIQKDGKTYVVMQYVPQTTSVPVR